MRPLLYPREDVQPVRMSHRRDALLLLGVSVASFTLFAAFEYGIRVAGLLLVAYFLVGMFVFGYVIGPWLKQKADRVTTISDRIDGIRFLR